jgi:glycolate dehydrogenase FAD-binding subunit
MNIEYIQQQILDADTLQIIGSGSQQAPQHDNTLDMSLYEGVVEYHPEELMLTVKAGTSIEHIKQTLAENNQALPFSVTNKTIGGAYAMGDAELRDAVLGIKIIDGQGRVLNFGGQVMKNVAGYDVTRLLVGSKGKLAAICEISLKVLPKTYVNTSSSSASVTTEPSKVRQRIEQGLKNVFDPNAVFI